MRTMFVRLVPQARHTLSRFVVAGKFILAGLFGPIPARRAGPGRRIHIVVDKASQRMAVHVNGRLEHVWTVSTGLRGGPPTGNFRPTRMHRSYFSRTYDNAPMPHSIFFHYGFAIHGTDHVSRLGRPASKGCVRLHRRNAAQLFSLVRRPAWKTPASSSPLVGAWISDEPALTGSGGSTCLRLRRLCCRLGRLLG